MPEHDHREEDAGRSTTQGEYLRKLARENAQKLIVFIDDRFGIYFTTEFALLLGRRIKRPNARAAKTIEELMARLEQDAAKG